MTNGATKATEYSDSVTVRRHYLPLLSLSFELITRTRTRRFQRTFAAVLTSRLTLRFNHRKSNICPPLPVLMFISRTTRNMIVWISDCASIGDVGSDWYGTRNQTFFRLGNGNSFISTIEQVASFIFNILNL